MPKNAKHGPFSFLLTNCRKCTILGLSRVIVVHVQCRDKMSAIIQPSDSRNFHFFYSLHADNISPSFSMQTTFFTKSVPPPPPPPPPPSNKVHLLLSYQIQDSTKSDPFMASCHRPSAIIPEITLSSSVILNLLYNSLAFGLWFQFRNFSNVENLLQLCQVGSLEQTLCTGQY